LTLIAFVVESQLTQYVQSTLHFRQPFFLFYIVHSSFAITFPLHLIYLVLTTSASLESLLAGLSLAVKIHFAPSVKSRLATLRSRFPYGRFFRLTAFLTFGLNLPSLLWFVSVSLSPLCDITAIWNTNAFFAYIITVQLFKLNWEPRKLFAVLIATFGVLAVVYGDAGQSELPQVDQRKAFTSETVKPKAPLLGDLLSLCASFGYGLYQVLYKRHAALLSDQELELGAAYIPLLDSDDLPVGELGESDKEVDDLAYPPPFGLHPNLLACGIGLMTLFSFWIMLPILHYSGYEQFRLPDDPAVVLSIAGMAGSGLVFNAGLLTLLGIWGPVVVSVGNLLTIVLVLLSDVSVGQGVDVITPWNLAGSGGIIVAFGILVYDMVQHPQPYI
jgi:drug/metabolite transporter (DMT)-like permease